MMRQVAPSPRHRLLQGVPGGTDGVPGVHCCPLDLSPAPGPHILGEVPHQPHNNNNCKQPAFDVGNSPAVGLHNDVMKPRVSPPARVSHTIDAILGLQARALSRREHMDESESEHDISHGSSVTEQDVCHGDVTGKHDPGKSKTPLEK